MGTQKASNWIDAGLLLLRVGIGLMFVVHGLPKVQGGPEMWEKVGSAMGNVGINFAPVFWGLCAALAEFAGGICLVLGLLTRPAALTMAFTMVIAALMHFSKGDGIQLASHAIEAGIVFLSLALTGAGTWSVDGFVCRRMRGGNSGKYNLPA